MIDTGANPDACMKTALRGKVTSAWEFYQSIVKAIVDAEETADSIRLKCQITTGVDLSKSSHRVSDDSSTIYSSTTSSYADQTTTCPPTHAICCYNNTRSHRVLFTPGLRMFPEVRYPLVILPRALSGRCEVHIANIGECPQPCQWVSNYSRACSRRCDNQNWVSNRMSYVGHFRNC